MSLEDDLGRLVKEVVKRELDTHRRASELCGRGGDVAVGGMGNVYITPGPNKKAYYNGNEIGTSAGYVQGSGSTGGIAVWTAGNTIGVGSVYSDTAFRNSVGFDLYSGDPGIYSGEIRVFNGTYSAHDLLIRAKNASALHLEGAAGIYIASPLVANLAMGGYKVTGLGAPSLETDSARYKDGFMVCTSTTRPTLPTEGMHIYETDTDKDYKCTVGGATPTWVEVGAGGSGDVVANGTRTLNRLTKWTNATTKEVGNSSITDDGINPITIGNTVVPYASSTYNLGSSSYYWKDIYADGKVIIGATDVYLEHSVGNLNLCTGSAWRLAATDTEIVTSVQVRPTSTDTLDLGTASYYWRNMYTQKLYLDDTGYYLEADPVNKILKIHVPADGKFQFIVG